MDAWTRLQKEVSHDYNQRLHTTVVVTKFAKN